MEWVCSSCLGKNEYFSKYIKSKNEKRKCAYCKTTKNVASFEYICDCVRFALGRYFSNADENSPRDWETKEFLETPYSVSEVIQELFMEDSSLSDCRQEVIDDLIGKLDDEQPLCRKYWRGDDPDDVLSRSWGSFCDLIKYRKRFCYNLHDKPLDEFFDIPPDQILDQILDVVLIPDLIRIFKKNTPVIFRARQTGGEIVEERTALGSPPISSAYASRMNPTGIPHFYGAFDLKTALKEVMPLKSETKFISYGEWNVIDSLVLLDFTFLPPLPSIFDIDRASMRDAYGFLRSFLNDIAQKVEHDGREHIDYIPTQIVSEYFRSKIEKLDGIVYKSVRNEGKCLVLFPHHDPKRGKPEDERLHFKSTSFLMVGSESFISVLSEKMETPDMNLNTRSIPYPNPETLKPIEVDISEMNSLF